MILVTPEDVSSGGVQVTTADLDQWWRRLIEWVNDVGGASKWVANLWNFKMNMVPIVNAVRAFEVIDVANLKSLTLIRILTLPPD